VAPRYQVYDREGFARIEPMTAAARWRLAGGGVLALALLALFFRGVDWSALLGALRSAHPGFLSGVVLLTVVTYLVRAWRWGYLLAPLARVPFLDLFSATSVGFMTGLVVPRAGEVVRPYLVGRRHAIPVSAAFASIILERLVDLITVLLLFGAYLYVLPLPAAQTRGPLLGLLKAGGAVAGLAAVGVLLVLLAFRLRGERAMALVDRCLRPLPARLSGPVARGFRSFGEGLAVLQAPASHLAAIFGQSLVLWFSIDLTMYLNNRAFGLDLPFHSTFLLIAFLTVGVAVPTPGMVGGFHESYLLALTQAYGVDKGTAAAAGITAHALSNLPVLLMGLLFLGREGLTFGKVAEMTERRPPAGGTAARVAAAPGLSAIPAQEAAR
jgi:glycosyltransferase 2 family protein